MLTAKFSFVENGNIQLSLVGDSLLFQCNTESMFVYFKKKKKKKKKKREEETDEDEEIVNLEACVE